MDPGFSLAGQFGGNKWNCFEHCFISSKQTQYGNSSSNFEAPIWHPTEAGPSAHRIGIPPRYVSNGTPWTQRDRQLKVKYKAVEPNFYLYCHGTCFSVSRHKVRLSVAFSSDLAEIKRSDKNYIVMQTYSGSCAGPFMVVLCPVLMLDCSVRGL